MSPKAFTELPLLLSRRHLLALGMSWRSIADCTWRMRRDMEEIPPGFIGWIPNHPGSRCGKFRKWDVAKLLRIKEEQ
jgi:hypothetical protein